jgi:predicted amidohydrolase
MQNLIITLIQTELEWEDAEANLRRFDIILDRLDAETDLIILPEMFSTGFSMNADRLAENMQGETVEWLRQKARKFQSDVIGSLIIVENGRYYNRLCWATPDNRMLTYDKKHLFRYAGEDKVYAAGRSLIVAEIKGWKIRPFICYDLRFPVWSRNVGSEYDVAVYIANWPERRAAHWKSLLEARAIENQVYVIGVNRIGTDGNGIYYSGDSSIINPQGKVLFRNSHAPCLYSTQLDFDLLEKYRRSFPAWMDVDHFDLR